jgi:chromosome segregation ATPase
MDDIQPLNELGEREVHQPEIEDILAKMKAMKIKLDGLEKQIKPLEAQHEQLDAEVDDMIHDEKTSKLHTGDGQLTQLNLDIADIDVKKANAEKLLARYRGAIANAKKKEGRDDAALSDWLSTLGTEADGIDG